MIILIKKPTLKINKMKNNYIIKVLKKYQIAYNIKIVTNDF